ncbi:MAG: XisI protein [Cyanobacteria bacterium P01_C01_bin.69]
MGSVSVSYCQIIEKLLREYADFLSQDDTIQQELVFDREHDRYLLIEAGWQNQKRIYGPFLHLDIRDDKVWIQHDGTEDGIAYELESAGIPKDRIVLAYKSLKRRKLTDYAVS